MDNLKTFLTVLAVVALIPTAWSGVSELVDDAAVSRQARGYMKAARLANEADDLEREVTALRLARELSPSNYTIVRALALAECRLSVLKPDSLTPVGAIRLGVQLEALKLNASAGPEVAVALGQIALIRSRNAVAHELFDGAAKLYPNNALVQYAVAKSLLLRKDVTGAVSALRSAVSARPKSALFRKALGRALTRDDKWGAAVEAYRQSLEIEDNTLVQVQLGEALLKIGNDSAAVEVLKKAVNGTLERELLSRAQAALGFALFKVGKVAESATHLERAVAISPSPGLWFNLGSVRNRMKEHRRAVQAFSRGLELDGSNSSAHLGLIRALLGLGQVERARQVRDRLQAIAQRVPAAKEHFDAAQKLIGVQP